MMIISEQELVDLREQQLFLYAIKNSKTMVG